MIRMSASAFALLALLIPESPAAQASYEKGNSLIALGKREEALEEFKQTAAKSRGKLFGDKCLIALGLIFRDQGRIEESLKSFQDVASRRTDEVGAEGQYRIGETQFLQKEYAKAATSLLRVKYVYPSSEDWIARSYLKMGEAYEQNSERGKAREAYQVVLQSHNDDQFGQEATLKLQELK